MNQHALTAASMKLMQLCEKKTYFSVFELQHIGAIRCAGTKVALSLLLQQQLVISTLQQLNDVRMCAYQDFKPRSCFIRFFNSGCFRFGEREHPALHVVKRKRLSVGRGTQVQ